VGNVFWFQIPSTPFFTLLFIVNFFM